MLEAGHDISDESDYRSIEAHNVTAVAVLVMVVVFVSACTAAPNAAAGQGPTDAGFWLGLWHGVIAPIAFLVSLFDDSVGI